MMNFVLQGLYFSFAASRHRSTTLLLLKKFPVVKSRGGGGGPLMNGIEINSTEISSKVLVSR